MPWSVLSPMIGSVRALHGDERDVANRGRIVGPQRCAGVHVPGVAGYVGFDWCIAALD